MLLPGLWPIAYAAARLMAYRIRCCSTYGLSHTLPSGLWPIAYTATRPMASSLWPISQQQSLLGPMAYGVRCCSVSSLQCTLPPVLWHIVYAIAQPYPIAYAAARLMAYSVHPCPAYVIYPTLLPSLCSSQQQSSPQQPPLRPTTYSVRHYQTHGL